MNRGMRVALSMGQPLQVGECVSELFLGNFKLATMGYIRGTETVEIEGHIRSLMGKWFSVSSMRTPSSCLIPSS